MLLSRSRVVLMVAGASIAGAVIAQPSDDRVSQFVTRTMSQDANGDGKLDKSEVYPRFAAEVFDDADVDSDGFITSSELHAHVMARGGRIPGPQPAPEAGVDAADEAFSEAMSLAASTIRGLRRSPMDATSLKADLELVQRLQVAMLDAKASLHTVEMAPQAKEKYADDTEAYHRDFRLGFIDAIEATLVLERALLAGDTDASKAAFSEVRAVQGAGHDAFQADD